MENNYRNDISVTTQVTVKGLRTVDDKCDPDRRFNARLVRKMGEIRVVKEKNKYK